MADIVIDIDYSDLSRTVDELKKLGKSIKETGNVGKDTARAFEQAERQILRWRDSFVTQQGKINTALEKSYQQQKLSNKSAKDSAQAWLEADIAAKKLADRQEELRMRFQDGYAVNQRYRQSVNDLKEAYRAGLIPTLEAYKQKLRELRTAQQQGLLLNKGNVAGTNNLGVAMQQIGYQVGDFAVQVQSGTSAFVAFGQQATQLVGIMYLLPPAVLASKVAFLGLSLSVAAIAMTLGIAIPIVTGIGAAWWRMSQDADSAKKALDPLEERLKSIDNVIANWKFDKQAKILNLDPDVYASVQELEAAERNLKEAKTNLDNAMKASSLSQALPAPLSILKVISDLVVTTNDAEAAQKRYNEALDRLSGIQAKIAEEQQKIYEDEYVKLTESKEIELAILKYGKDSLEVKQRIADAESRAYRDSLKSLGISETQVEILMAQYAEYQDLISAQEELNKKWRGLSKELQDMLGLDLSGMFYKAASAVDTMNARLDSTLSKIGGILAAIGSIGFDTIAIEAETRALKAGKSAAQANIEGQLARDRAGLEQGGALDPIALAGLATKRKALEDRAAASAARQAELDKLKDSSGGSKKKEQEDYLTGLLKEAEYKKSIIGLSEEEARRKEIIFELTEKGLPIEDARIQKVLEAEAALKKATEAEDKRKAMIERVQSSMEDAFMSMVDGSKSVADAFKGMLREILLDIYRQQVAQPVSNFLGDMLGGFLGGIGGAPTSSIRPRANPRMANGGAWNNGVQMFANGGVVDSATMFKHGGGLGVMGEAGPEAIMPLKRGKDGKLGVQMQGSSGAVVVHQTFNFSANGDDSVKKIIAQAAPQIAMMTQQQIMDSRRRGGSMKAALG